MDAKKIVTLVVLVAVIVGAIYFSAKRSGVVGSAVPTKVVNASEPVELVDKTTLEVMTKTAGEWEKLGGGPGGFKNPNTGTYTMVPVMICQECGAKIPLKSRFPHGNYDPATLKCPKCGKNPFGAQFGQPH